MTTKAFFGLLLLLAFSSTCMGGWLENTLDATGKRLGNRAVNDTGNSAYDAAKGGTRDTVKGKSTLAPKSGQKEIVQAPSDGAATIEEAEAVYAKFDFISAGKN